MSIGGPLPLDPLSAPRPSESILSLQLNQRVAAEVIQVGGERLVLAINGIPIVARLTQPDQAAALEARKTAQFIVRDPSQNNLTLELVGTGEAVTVIHRARLPGTDLVGQLLTELGAADGPDERAIAQALIRNGLDVTPRRLAQLQAALEGIAGWGEQEAGTAAALAGRGLPLSTAALALVLNRDGQFLDAFLSALQAGRNEAAAGGQPPDRLTLQRALAFLEGLVVDGGQDTTKLAAQLKRALSLAGQSLENLLANMSREIQASNSGPSILDLASALRVLLAGKHIDEGEAIGRGLDALRMNQYLNTNPIEEPHQGNQLMFHFPVHLLPGNQGVDPKDWMPAQLQIQCSEEEGSGRKIDPDGMNFSLKVEFEPGQGMEVHVAILKGQAGVRVVSSNTELADLAEEEIPGLDQGLTALGYRVRAARFETAPLGGMALFEQAGGRQVVIDGVDLEV